MSQPRRDDHDIIIKDNSGVTFSFFYFSTADARVRASRSESRDGTVGLQRRSVSSAVAADKREENREDQTDAGKRRVPVRMCHVRETKNAIRTESSYNFSYYKQKSILRIKFIHLYKIIKYSLNIYSYIYIYIIISVHYTITYCIQRKHVHAIL